MQRYHKANHWEMSMFRFCTLVFTCMPGKLIQSVRIDLQQAANIPVVFSLTGNPTFIKPNVKLYESTFSIFIMCKINIFVHLHRVNTKPKNITMATILTFTSIQGISIGRRTGYRIATSHCPQKKNLIIHK